MPPKFRENTLSGTECASADKHAARRITTSDVPGRSEAARTLSENASKSESTAPAHEAPNVNEPSSDLAIEKLREEVRELQERRRWPGLVKSVVPALLISCTCSPPPV